MKTKIKKLVCATILFSSCLFAQKSYEVVSPDGKLKMNFYTADSKDAKGELVYNIFYKEMPVIKNSYMGMGDWERNFSIEKEEKTSINTTWKPLYGERAEVRDNYNQSVFIVKKDGQESRLHIIVRAYNEGIAFRYYFAEIVGGVGYGKGGRMNIITTDKTTFVTPNNTNCYLTYAAQSIPQFKQIKNWDGEAERPLILKLENGLYAALGEAALVSFPRTKFTVKSGEENIIRCSMYDAFEDYSPFASPWKLVMVAERPTDLLANNDIYLNLNPENQIKNTSWIKPGKIFRHGLTTVEGKEAVDFAVKRKLQHVIISAGWYGNENLIDSNPLRCDNVDPDRSKVNNLNLEEITKYAKTKGIGVWVYVNQRALTKYLDEMLPLYQKWGIAGIKFGFVTVGSYKWTTWLHEAVQKCAKYNIMVNIHDEYRPTGFSRTYPNLLTHEGVRGNEEFPDANTNTTLPFTRFVCGPADYTICYFQRKEFKPTVNEDRLLKNTCGHQLALSVVFYSPLQYLYWYDKPSDVLDVPELEFYDKVPTVWDDTKILNGEIGEYISVARKSGNKWFVGCLTNNNARVLEFSFDFLDSTKKYEATIYSDGGEKVKTPTHVKIEKKSVTATSKQKFDLLARGGCTMIIEETYK